MNQDIVKKIRRPGNLINLPQNGQIYLTKKDKTSVIIL